MEKLKLTKVWYLCTTWTTGVKRLDVVKETSQTVVTADGTRIGKRYSKTQFLGKTREDAKAKYIAELNEDLALEIQRVEKIKKQIEDVQSW